MRIMGFMKNACLSFFWGNMTAFFTLSGEGHTSGILEYSRNENHRVFSLHDAGRNNFRKQK
jgi:hypothetical protein